MKILVWQWGRFGAGPRIAADYAAAFGALPGVDTVLSLSRQSEIMAAGTPPRCGLPVTTYQGVPSYLWRALQGPVLAAQLGRAIRAEAPDLALCAMPGPLDLVMAHALKRAGVPFAVVVHDADAHPGDGYPLQMALQRALVRRAGAIVALSAHVAERLQAQGLASGKPLIRSVLPQPPMTGLPQVRAHGGPFRLLSFGRLLAYKGLDLLADALAMVLPGAAMQVRVVGEGPESAALAALRALPGVTVENRWVPDAEIPALLGWADGVVLSHREASQSGVAASALAARRFLIATRVGGLAEQAAGDPAAFLCDVSAEGLARAIREASEAAAPGAGPGGAACESLLAELNMALRG